MAVHPIDRRVVRTRASLEDALASLIREKAYEAITVQDICKAANVGRSTFYAHYTGKDDLKRRSLERLRRLLVERRGEIPTATGNGLDLGFSLAMFEHARDYLDHYRALAGGRGGSVALDTVRRILSGLVREELTASADRGEDAIPREFIVQHVVGAYIAVLTWWLDGGARLSPERMDTMFRRLVNGSPA